MATPKEARYTTIIAFSRQQDRNTTIVKNNNPIRTRCAGGRSMKNYFIKEFVTGKSILSMCSSSILFDRLIFQLQFKLIFFDSEMLCITFDFF